VVLGRGDRAKEDMAIPSSGVGVVCFLVSMDQFVYVRVWPP
jgi:hypothetical protein